MRNIAVGPLTAESRDEALDSTRRSSMRFDSAAAIVFLAGGRYRSHLRDAARRRHNLDRLSRCDRHDDPATAATESCMAVLLLSIKVPRWDTAELSSRTAKLDRPAS